MPVSTARTHSSSAASTVHRPCVCTAPAPPPRPPTPPRPSWPGPAPRWVAPSAVRHLVPADRRTAGAQVVEPGQAGGPSARDAAAGPGRGPRPNRAQLPYGRGSVSVRTSLPGAHRERERRGAGQAAAPQPRAEPEESEHGRHGQPDGGEPGAVPAGTRLPGRGHAEHPAEQQQSGSRGVLPVRAASAPTAAPAAVTSDGGDAEPERGDAGPYHGRAHIGDQRQQHARRPPSTSSSRRPSARRRRPERPVPHRSRRPRPARPQPRAHSPGRRRHLRRCRKVPRRWRSSGPAPPRAFRLQQPGRSVIPRHRPSPAPFPTATPYGAHRHHLHLPASGGCRLPHTHRLADNETATLVQEAAIAQVRILRPVHGSPENGPRPPDAHPLHTGPATVRCRKVMGKPHPRSTPRYPMAPRAAGRAGWAHDGQFPSQSAAATTPLTAPHRRRPERRSAAGPGGRSRTC